MKATPLETGRPHAPPPRRSARYAALGLAAAGAALLVHAAVAGAQLEVLLVALGLAAGAALVGLLATSESGGVVIRTRD